MYRLPDPLTEESLGEPIRDDRYWQRGHPERQAYRDFVTEGFKTFYAGRTFVRDGRGRLVEADSSVSGGTVHVRAHTRIMDGQVVQVQSHQRSAPVSARLPRIRAPSYRELVPRL